MSSPVADTPLLAYEVVTRHPTKLGNVRVVVDETGAVRVQRNDVEPGDGQDWSADLPATPSKTIANAPSRLHALLEDGDFFTMDELQVNEDATDGIVRTLTWNGADGPRTVTIDRARSPQFDQLVVALARELGVAGM